MNSLTKGDVLARCERLGFALAGVCDAGPIDHRPEFLAWLAEGKHATMTYLARDPDIRADPACVLPGARSAIVVADLYRVRATSVKRPAPETQHLTDAPASAQIVRNPGQGTIASYARGRDYHKVMKRRLHDLCDDLRRHFPHAGFRAFVDTAPVMERELAQRAGLGWIGKHTLLIHPSLGSYFLLGGILTTLEIEASGSRVADHCGTCTRCIDACPTSAITPHSIDASRCVSYLTIENRGIIDSRFHAAMGEWLYGCDICQDVCPHNSARQDGIDVGRINDAYTPRRANFDLLEVLGWSEEDRQRECAGTALTRATLHMMKRNAIIIAANDIRRGCPDPQRSALLGRLREIADQGVNELSTLAGEILRGLNAG